MQQELIAKNWRDLIRPRRLEVEEDSLTTNYGRFACEPLERGFGTTLGNALRRVLLSSLQGAAITSIRINGVLHEFSTIPGVIEDVAEIVLNLKEVRLRMHAEGPKVLHRAQEGRRRRDSRRSGFGRPDGRGDEPRPQDLHPGAGSGLRDRGHRRTRQGLRAGRAEQDRGHADRHDADRLDLLARPQDQLHRHAGSRRSRDRLRPSQPRGLDGRSRASVRRGGLRGEDPEGAAHDLHQLRGAGRDPAARWPRSPSRSTRTSSSRWTSSSCRCVRRTACRTPTSASSASWCSAPRPRCSRRRTSAASR